jgi:hypothetical protein
MTTPRVTELPRRLEPVGRDTFLGAAEGSQESAPLARIGNVFALRPRSAVTQLRPSVPRPPRAAA